MKRTLTRRDFLKVAGTGAAGTALLGGLGCGKGTGKMQVDRTNVNKTNVEGLNVILVIIDSLRKDHVGAYGNYQAKTPNLDAIARDGLRFARAYPDAMPTIPARRAIHTGMRTFPYKDRPEQQRSAPVYGWLPIPEEQRTLAEILQGHGHRTILVTDTYHEFMPPMNFQRGFGTFRGIRGQENDTLKDPSSVSEEEMEKYLQIQPDEIRQYLANTQDRNSEEDWFAPTVFLNAMELLESASKGGPFFLVADCYDPHEPWDPPAEYVSLHDPDGYEGSEPFNPRYGEDSYLTERQLLRMRALYSAEVTMADHWLGRFLDKVEELNLFENTLLMVISDHGHLLGEHGYTGKLNHALYPELTDIVLMVRHPEGKRAGEESDYFASTHDVAPTILGFLGIEPPHPMDGQNLCVLLEGRSPEPRNHFTLGYGIYSRTQDDQYVMFGRNDGSEAKLFDVLSDPDMHHDIAATDPERVKKMFEEYVLADAGGSLPTVPAEG
ncbi:MAG: sulfatase [Actinomycetota bacterium]|nr:sulfatase [Actinomycetota bacterium]